MSVRQKPHASYVRSTQMVELINDLFGEVPPSPAKVSTAGQAHGYAASPGTGPKGETCGSCQHLYRKRMAKTYLKCALMSAMWTGGHGTDVLARSPACVMWAQGHADN
jgi:hypothetical protein